MSGSPANFPRLTPPVHVLQLVSRWIRRRPGTVGRFLGYVGTHFLDTKTRTNIKPPQSGRSVFLARGRDCHGHLSEDRDRLYRRVAAAPVGAGELRPAA